MILLDTESTGLHEITASPIERQPRIIEIALLKVDDKTLKEKDSFQTLINPGIPIPAKNVEITGITDELVKDAKKFAAFFNPLVDLFLGERILVGHNLPYDVQIMVWELTRIDRLTKFPWPPQHLCTVELTQDLSGKYFNLNDLYVHYYKKPPENKAHRAMADVITLHEVVKAMRKEKRL